jgi:aspartyl-tRNA synthetase
VAFIDLRDFSGSIQVVISDESIASALRAEWCVLIEGEVAKRPAGNENHRSATCVIEIV